MAVCRQSGGGINAAGTRWYPRKAQVAVRKRQVAWCVGVAYKTNREMQQQYGGQSPSRTPGNNVVVAVWCNGTHKT